MPRILQMADVHLGARHDDLGPIAAAQRERQFAAFARAVDLALTEKVDLVLICGDLFDSNSQPRRSVERAAAELSKLVARHVPVVVIPGTHDCYEPGSIYRVFDLAEMAGAAADSGLVTVLTDGRRQADFTQLGVSVLSHVFPAKRAAESPLIAIRGDVEAARADGPRAGNWLIGMIHGSIAQPGRFEHDEVIVTDEEIAQSGLDYLALGHVHSVRDGRAGNVSWAYSGAPEPVALDQDGAGQVLLVNLEERDGQRVVRVEPRPVGKTRFRKLEVDGATVASQAALAAQLRELADPDLVLDARIVGVRSSELDLNTDELTRQLEGSFLRLRLRDSSVVGLPDDAAVPADTILGALTRDFRARIEDHETRGDAERAGELREALRLGTALLDDPTRVTLA
ncbi:MAG: repair protein SbcD/Mre11 [Chloroflexota bacterium]|jgi:DNA repair exonuclease SbcCD nuclease subunit|nr:repair protein SbcD/Mre11 [Chloroflexota bacterium]